MSTNPARLLLALTMLGILLLPLDALARENLPRGWESTIPQSSQSSSAPLLSSSSSAPDTELGAPPELPTWEERQAQTAGFWASMMNNRKAIAAHRLQTAARREKRGEIRIACRGDVRRANRDSVLSEMLRCFRALLTLDLEQLRKDKQIIEIMEGVPAEKRAEALASGNHLSDAVATIISAIDAGIYESKESVLEAKRNLAERYRVPYASTWTILRLERLITFILHLTIRIRDIPEESEISEDVSPLLEDVSRCYAAAYGALAALRDQEYNAVIIDAIRQAHSDAKNCEGKLRSAISGNRNPAED